MNDRPDTPALPRRRLLGAGAAALSAAGLAALAGTAAPALARKGGDAAQDAALLNAAVALEHEGIAAYQISLDSGLLAAEVAGLARLFQDHHKQHRDDLAAAIRRLGARAVAAKPLADYAAALNAGAIKSQDDILKLALRLERGAANAYLGLIAPLKNADLDVLVARLPKAGPAAALETAFGASIREIEPVWREHVEMLAVGSATDGFERIAGPSAL